MSNEAETPAEKPSLFAGFVILLIVIMGIVGWILLGGGVLKLSSLYASFLFLWYWSAVEKLDMKKLVPGMLGALIGIALAAGLHHLPLMSGTLGFIIAISAVVIAVYLGIVERVPALFNTATMLYLTVAAAPAIMESTDFREMAVATLLGGGFFAALVFGAQRLAAMMSPAPEADETTG
ncbi:hypothetical protein [Ponticaulis profundi]|uniref:DUF1097 domain-containing protein n=1 Tax=Ponticaulis profundi TaxID=2665222 RepID=A0ABW1S693_9PROT